MPFHLGRTGKTLRIFFKSKVTGILSFEVFRDWLIPRLKEDIPSVLLKHPNPLHCGCHTLTILLYLVYANPIVRRLFCVSGRLSIDLHGRNAAY